MERQSEEEKSYRYKDMQYYYCVLVNSQYMYLDKILRLYTLLQNPLYQ